MKRCAWFFTVLAALCMAGDLWAVNSVVVESKTVAPNETSVTIGVYVTNDVSLLTLVLPLEIREITSGSFTTTFFDFDVQGRVAASGLTEITLHDFFAEPEIENSCSGPMSHTWAEAAPTPAGFFTSPDAVLWAGSRVVGPYLAPGSDVTPSFLFTFDVTGTPGQFEIDTCCRAASNHLAFMDIDHMVQPVDFIKGVVTIQSSVCNNRPADVNCDGAVDVLDVVSVVNVAFRGATEPGPCCAIGP